MPFHVISVSIIGNRLGYSVNDLEFILIKMWKEFFVIMAIGFALFTVSKKNDTRGLFFIDYAVLIFTLIGVLYVVFAERIVFAVWSFRSLYAIYLFYLLGRVQRLSADELLKIARAQFAIAIVASIFGIYLVEFYEGDFYKEYYGDDAPAQLESNDYEKSRTTSLFVSVHEFGLYLVFQLFALPWILRFVDRRAVLTMFYYFVGSIVILIGLFYSFSRSSILILLLGITLIGIRKVRYLIPAFAFLIVIYFLFSYFDVFSNIETVTSGGDSSTIGHIAFITDALRIFSKNIFGIGLGKAGVVARRFDPAAPQFEGEWFNILVQMGIIQSALYLLIFLYIFYTAYRLYKKDRNTISKELSLIIILISMGMFLRDLILPRDQINFYYGWFIIGAYYSLLKTQLTNSNTHS
jgi:hypothetical protein